MEAFEKLYEAALERKVSPKENSYTNYLLDKGVEKITKKVGEESTEVVIAAIKRDNAELVTELADLFYHLAVLMVNQGVAPRDVEAELKRRSEKEGNLKPERKPIKDI